MTHLYLILNLFIRLAGERSMCFNRAMAALKHGVLRREVMSSLFVQASGVFRDVALSILKSEFSWVNQYELVTIGLCGTLRSLRALGTWIGLRDSKR